MKIDSNNYRKFYFGTGTEYYFLSKFYMMGFEAYKLNPDIGYDLQVSNTAKCLYEKKEKVEFNIQIKSSILVKEYTEFWISDKDFSMILNDEIGIILCSIYKPSMKGDPNSFYYDRNNNTWEKHLEEGFMNTFIEDYHKYNVEDRDRIFKFVDFNFKYFWLNRIHLRRLLDENFISEFEKDNIKYKKIKIQTNFEDNTIRLLGNDRMSEDESYYSNVLVDEIRSIYYLMNDCQSTEKLKEGKMFSCDNEQFS